MASLPPEYNRYNFYLLKVLQKCKKIWISIFLVCSAATCTPTTGPTWGPCTTAVTPTRKNTTSVPATLTPRRPEAARTTGRPVQTARPCPRRRPQHPVRPATPPTSANWPPTVQWTTSCVDPSTEPPHPQKKILRIAFSRKKSKYYYFSIKKKQTGLYFCAFHLKKNHLSN